jgi:hypothetical protein
VADSIRTANKRPAQTIARSVESVVAPAAIERALSIYQQLQQRDPSVVLQAKKSLTQHIFGMVDRGERDEQRLTVFGLIRLKAVERDNAIKSAQESQKFQEQSKDKKPMPNGSAQRRLARRENEGEAK